MKGICTVQSKLWFSPSRWKSHLGMCFIKYQIIESPSFSHSFYYLLQSLSHLVLACLNRVHFSHQRVLRNIIDQVDAFPTLSMVNTFRGDPHGTFGFGQGPLQVLPSFHQMMGLVHISLQFRIEFGPPERDIVKSLTDATIRIALCQDGAILAIAHQTDGFVANTLGIVACVIRTVEMRHVRAWPIRGWVASVIGHPGRLRRELKWWVKSLPKWMSKYFWGEHIELAQIYLKPRACTLRPHLLPKSRGNLFS